MSFRNGVMTGQEQLPGAQRRGERPRLTLFSLFAIECHIDTDGYSLSLPKLCSGEPTILNEAYKLELEKESRARMCRVVYSPARDLVVECAGRFHYGQVQ